MPPTATATIDNPQALADLVRDCAAKQTPIVDYGVAHTGLGHPPTEPHTRLAQRGGVIEHYDRDMTVRAAAGITMAELQAALKVHRQFAPVDADDDVTLGEVIDHNVYGPLRVGYGAMRDLLLGLRYIDGQGRDIHVGGRTVKNVAGYDVTRFMVGGLGQYGIVYEATMRTYSIPQEVMDVELRLEDPALLDGRLSQWLLTPAAPAALQLVRRDHQWALHLAYFGTSHGCATQLSSLEALANDTAGMQVDAANESDLDGCTQRDAVLRRWRRDVPAVIKLIVPPAKTGAACKHLAAWGAEFVKLNIDALPVHGCIFAGGDLDAERAVKLDQTVNALVQSCGGLRIWHQRPDSVDMPKNGPTIEPFAPPQSDWPLLHKLKRTMDPNGILNPGRFVDAVQEQSA